MHEIRTTDDPRYKEDFVVCRLERRPDKKPSISTRNDSESSQEHVAGVQDASPESVLPPNQPSISNRNHVAEKTLKLQQLPKHCCNGYRGLDIEYFPELQSLTDPEPGWSHSNSPINGCDLLNSHCDREPVSDHINLQRAFQTQNECFFGETGQTLCPEFNSSKSDGGILLEVNSEMDAKAFDEWVNSLLANEY